MLHGHERSITQIKYNCEGDLLFSASKDPTPNVWFSVNGERLGTFDGHSGAVWSIDVSYDSKHFVTGAADMKLKLWEVKDGSCITTVNTETSVRGTSFSYCGTKIAYVTDQMMGKDGKLCIMDTRENNEQSGNTGLSTFITPYQKKALHLVWGRLDHTIVTGHADGTVSKWDARNLAEEPEPIESVQEHSLQINDLQVSQDQSMFITASKDTTAKLWDLDKFEPIATYKTDRPVNSAAISPIIDKCPHVALGGGQEAMDVTTSSTRVGKFDARFFHLVFMEEFGRVKGHFGPINSIAFHPSGKGYASGAEDGYIRVHNFDDTYYQYQLEY